MNAKAVLSRLARWALKCLPSAPSASSFLQPEPPSEAAKRDMIRAARLACAKNFWDALYALGARAADGDTRDLSRFVYDITGEALPRDELEVLGHAICALYADLCGASVSLAHAAQAYEDGALATAQAHERDAQGALRDLRADPEACLSMLETLAKEES